MQIIFQIIASSFWNHEKFRENFLKLFAKKALMIFAQTIFISAMYKLKSFQIPVAFVASLIAQSTFAQGTITSFEAEPQRLSSGGSSSYIEIGGSFSQRIEPISSGTISGQLDLNSDDLTATFRRMTLDVDETIELAGDFVVGSGGVGDTQQARIEGSIRFDSTIEFRDDQSLTTTQGLNGHHISGSDWEGASLPSTDQNRFEGSYQFSGPTESVEGTFSFSPQWQRYSSGNPVVIDTTDYPHGVTLIGGNEVEFWFNGNNHDLVSETIDGVDLSIVLMYSEFDVPGQMQFGIVPEPSEYALMIGLLLMGFVAFRRSFVKSGGFANR